jgi:hypothetical protein
LIPVCLLSMFGLSAGEFCGHTDRVAR